MTYKVALVGGGHIGNTHARHWQPQTDAEVVAVVDPRGAAVKIAGNPPVYTHWETMTAAVKPDIVDICTPTNLHREYVDRAAAAGMAVFCEKPIARTMADCDAIVGSVERHGIPFMAGHVVRYFPAFGAAKRLIDAGGIGKPAMARASRTGSYPGAGRQDPWYGDHEKSGGAVLDLSLHDLDWLRWCCGDVSTVYAQGLYKHPTYQTQFDYALINLGFSSGAIGHVTVSWAHPPGLRATFEIAGDAGLVEFDSSRTATLTVWQRENGVFAPGRAPVAKSPMAASDDPYLLELSAFLDALRRGLPPPVTVYDAREAVRIALAALESIETGKVVTLA